MQEEYIHLTKRHQVLRLFHINEEKMESDNEWISKSKSLPAEDSSCRILAKFADGHIEPVYFCKRLPHWWYVNPGMRNAVITQEILEWKYL